MQSDVQVYVLHWIRGGVTLLPRIEICGGIASGKTSLARLIARTGIKVILEDFKANPFWKLFCVNQVEYAFETELTFLLQHYRQYKNVAPGGLSICDASLLLDLAYADVNLQDGRKKIFLSLYEEIQLSLPPPVLLVHLRCGPHEQLRRIRRRARLEEKNVPLQYLNAVNNAVAERVKEIEKVEVLEIDSEVYNFAHNRKTMKYIIDLVSDAVK